MSWNYRVVKHEQDDMVFYTIHEVHYDENGEAIAYTENAVPAFGEDHQELKDSLIHQMGALTKPVLDAKIFEKVTPNEAEKYATKTAIDILKCSTKKSKE